MHFQLSEKICDIVRSDRVCVTVGGDHSVGLGTVFGHASAYPEEVMNIKFQFFSNIVF
jgi:arginase family enzyme